mgnify:CR=1 FL=1|tara:strand:- start:2488 stop:2943 length:456 start_codon:yes stop_codon:yes gene_type:complete
MKLDNLLLLAGGGYLLYTYMQKKQETQLGTTMTTEEILEEYFYENDDDATPPDVVGCMNEEASNYNPLATLASLSVDGGCIWEDVETLTDDSAQGEDFLPPITLGCTDGMATNYNPLADQDDGSCYFTPISDIYQMDIGQEILEEVDTGKG